LVRNPTTPNTKDTKGKKEMNQGYKIYGGQLGAEDQGGRKSTRKRKKVSQIKRGQAATEKAHSPPKWTIIRGKPMGFDEKKDYTGDVGKKRWAQQVGPF